MKKIMTISIFLMLSVVSHAVAQTETIGDYTWTYTAWESSGDHLANIEGVTPRTGDVVVPEIVATNSTTPCHVEKIANGVFEESKIKSIIIGDGIKYIGSRCFFGCEFLEKIVLPNTIVTIDSEAFFGCENVKDVTWPCTTPLRNDGGSKQQGALIMRDWGFKDVNSITNIVIPSGVSNILVNCFVQCGRAVNIAIPEGVTNIDDAAFAACRQLPKITLPKSLMSVGANIFDSCYSLTNVTFLGDAPVCERGIFSGANRDLVVYVPVGSKGWDGNPESTALPKYWPFNTEGGRRIVHIGETVNDEPLVVTNYVYSTVTNYVYSTVTNEVYHYSTVTNEVNHHTTEDIHHYSTITNEVFHYTTVTNELFHYSTVTNEVQNHMTVTNDLHHYSEVTNEVYHYSTVTNDVHHYETVTNEVQNYSTVTNVIHVYTTVTNVVEHLPEPGTSPYAGAVPSVTTTIVQQVESPYSLTDHAADRAIASVTVDGDTALDAFVLKDGKVYDSVLYVRNNANHAVKVTLPDGHDYQSFKGAAPLTLPAHSRNILTITRVAGGSDGGNVFLVTREELETVK